MYPCSAKFWPPLLLVRNFTFSCAFAMVEHKHIFFNCYGTEGPHITNSIEGWHSKLKKMTQHAHPNIYIAIQLFKDIQNSIEIAKIQRVVVSNH
jgi:hypothetical protein